MLRARLLLTASLASLASLACLACLASLGACGPRTSPSAHANGADEGQFLFILASTRARPTAR